MRLGVLLKSVIPYLLLYKFFAFIIMPRKKHRESRNLFIKEAKKLYQRNLSAGLHSLQKLILFWLYLE